MFNPCVLFLAMNFVRTFSSEDFHNILLEDYFNSHDNFSFLLEVNAEMLLVLL